MAERVAEKSRPTDCGCGHEVCPGVNYGSCPLPARKGLAEVLAEHERGDWSDRTYSCRGCVERFEASTEVSAKPTREELAEWRRAYSKVSHPRWSMADYNAHVEAAVLDWLRERLAGAREDVAVALLVTRDPAGPSPVVRAGCGQPAADAALAAVAEVLRLGEVRG